MSITQFLLLVAAGVGAGLTGSIAGLASLVSYPALLAFGLTPLAANVTNTVGLITNGIGSAAGSRDELRGHGRRVVRLSIWAAAGGAAGAGLLLWGGSAAFKQVVPLADRGWCGTAAPAGPAPQLARPPAPGRVR